MNFYVAYYSQTFEISLVDWYLSALLPILHLRGNALEYLYIMYFFFRLLQSLYFFCKHVLYPLIF